ncbi:phosphotransferase [Frankia sp. Cas3]|uniref:phosphotransferase family protein n=1 Tax=Frankia sp. Cas3 TaxID=3073926 RepID=UPI002AD40A9D|nr:phosphotransferase [Frankia sp. Cas3]
MNDAAVLLDELTAQMGLGGPAARSVVRVWALSGVERVRLADGRNVIFKYAREPFTGEAAVLRYVAVQGVPVPRVVVSIVHEGVLGMLLEDLGESVRVATAADGAKAAVAVHDAEIPDFLRVLDRAGLIELPRQALKSLVELWSRGRWMTAVDLDGVLAAIEEQADRLSAGTDLPPFGLCHSEFHPTSLHVGAANWRLLDWARAFVGPGLLDLASWQGTTGLVDPAALRRLIWAYIRTGGHGEASRPRAGLQPEMWALGWHRLWAVAWYLEQAITWINDPTQDTFVEQVVRRHLGEAVTCLNISIPSR